MYGDNVSFDNLAQLISKMSSLNYGSVVGTLGTLMEVIQLQLTHGRQVKLGDLGTLYLTLSGEGKDTPEELSSSDIKKSTIRFRPGNRLKKTIKTLDYEKVSEGASANEEPGAEDSAPEAAA